MPHHVSSDETIMDNGKVHIPDADPLWVTSTRTNGTGYHGVTLDKHAQEKGNIYCWRLIVNKQKLFRGRSARECCNQHPGYLKAKVSSSAQDDNNNDQDGARRAKGYGN